MENLIMLNNSNRRMNFNNNESNGSRPMQGNMPLGIINPLDVRTITNTINIDTRFRENYHSTSSTNLQIKLENIQKRVVSLKVLSIDMPMSFYTISKSRGNATFIIKKNKLLPGTNNKQAWLVTIPDGNYELEWLDENKGKNIIETVNTSIKNAKTGYLTDNNIFIEYSKNEYIPLGNSIVFDVDRASGKSNFKTGSNVINGLNNIEVLFNVSDNIITNPNLTELQQFLGWQLGFRKTSYSLNLNTTNNIASEGICMITGPRYGFISLNDKQTRSKSNFISAFNKSILDKHIISKISLSSCMDDVGSYKTASTLKSYNHFNQIREYFGPVDIKNLDIKLLDEYGKIIDLNNMDWSITLVFETLYD